MTLVLISALASVVFASYRAQHSQDASRAGAEPLVCAEPVELTGALAVSEPPLAEPHPGDEELVPIGRLPFVQQPDFALPYSEMAWPLEYVPQLELVSVRGDRVRITPFDEWGRAQREAFSELSYLFRSSRRSEVAIHPRLVELLTAISHTVDKPLVIISGHRDAGGRTSKGSYHVRGMAADIAVWGVKVRKLHKIARRLGAPGLGYYPQFIHVDVRSKPYRWSGR